MLMATALTIPLYKIVCSLSYLDYNALSLLLNKEYIQSTLINMRMYACSDIYSVQSTWFNLCATSYIGAAYCFNSLVESVVHAPSTSVLCDVSDCYSNMQYVDVRFISRVSNMTLLEFFSLQHCLIVIPGESALLFFRLYNPTSFDVVGISMYYVFPVISTLYINKIQCFCFDSLHIYSSETVELPVLFYISRSFDFTYKIDSCLLSYVFFIY